MPKKLFTRSRNEAFFRKILGLPSDKPHRTPIYVDGSRIIFATGEEKLKEQAAWDAEGRRAEIAENLGYFFSSANWTGKVKRLARTPGEKLDTLKTRKGLRDSKQITIDSHYIYREDDWSVEAILHFDNNTMMSINFIAAAGFSNFVDNYNPNCSAEASNFYSSNNDFSFYGRWIAIPGDRLNEENIKEAFLDWYKTRWTYTQGHPTHYGIFPEVTVNIEFRTEQEYEEEMLDQEDPSQA